MGGEGGGGVSVLLGVGVLFDRLEKKIQLVVTHPGIDLARHLGS